MTRIWARFVGDGEIAMMWGDAEIVTVKTADACEVQAAVRFAQDLEKRLIEAEARAAAAEKKAAERARATEQAAEARRNKRTQASKANKARAEVRELARMASNLRSKVHNQKREIQRLREQLGYDEGGDA